MLYFSIDCISSIHTDSCSAILTVTFKSDSDTTILRVTAVMWQELFWLKQLKYDIVSLFMTITAEMWHCLTILTVTVEMLQGVTILTVTVEMWYCHDSGTVLTVSVENYFDCNSWNVTMHNYFDSYSRNVQLCTILTVTVKIWQIQI